MIRNTIFLKNRISLSPWIAAYYQIVWLSLLESFLISHGLA